MEIKCINCGKAIRLDGSKTPLSGPNGSEFLVAKCDSCKKKYRCYVKRKDE